jgi:hypothetical protein
MEREKHPIFPQAVKAVPYPKPIYETRSRMLSAELAWRKKASREHSVATGLATEAGERRN